MHQFYLPDLSIPQLLLDEDESKHAIRVLRLRNGDTVQIVDGLGIRATALVRDDHPKRCVLEITERNRESTGRDFKLHLAIAPTKNTDRLEWLIEKATELGLDQCTLIQCEHSERTAIRLDRLEKLAVSAMKQSQQAWLPLIRGPIPFATLLENTTHHSLRFIAHCVDDPGKIRVQDLPRSTAETLVLIGPEGDFSMSEIQRANAGGIKAISLGTTRLRTETAGFVACCAVHFANS